MFWVIYFEKEKAEEGQGCPLLPVVKELMSIKFFVVWERHHHDPFLGTAEAGSRGLIVAFDNEWVLLQF